MTVCKRQAEVGAHLCLPPFYELLEGRGPPVPPWIVTPVGRDDSERRASQDFALRGDLLCCHGQRN